MALLDRPTPPSDDNNGGNNFNRDDMDVYIGDLTLNQQLEYTTTKRMLEQCNKDQLLEFSLKLWTYHKRFENTNKAIVHEWGLPNTKSE